MGLLHVMAYAQAMFKGQELRLKVFVNDPFLAVAGTSNEDRARKLCLMSALGVQHVGLLDCSFKLLDVLPGWDQLCRAHCTALGGIGRCLMFYSCVRWILQSQAFMDELCSSSSCGHALIALLSTCGSCPQIKLLETRRIEHAFAIRADVSPCVFGAISPSAGPWAAFSLLG
eukprot:3227395-Amphidinium_carterae.2